MSSNAAFKKRRDDLVTLAGDLQSSKVTLRREAILKMQDLFVLARKEGVIDMFDKKELTKVIETVFLPTLNKELAHQMKNKNPVVKKYIGEPLKMIVKCLVECVDDETENGDITKNSTGRVLLNAKAIDALFDHILENLENAPTKRDLFADYCDIIRSVMINRAYSLRVSYDRVEEFIKRLFTLLCNKENSLQQSHSKHISETLEFLVNTFPRDTLFLQKQLFSGFTNYFESFGSSGYEQTNMHIISMINNYLLKYTDRCISTVRKLAEDVTEHLCSIWQHTRADQLRADICTFFRIVLRSKVSQRDYVLSESTLSHVYQMIKFGLNLTRLFSFKDTMSTSREKLHLEHLHTFFDLGADVFYEVIVRSLVKIEDQDSLEPQQKRRRTLTLPDQIIEKITIVQNNSTADNIIIYWQTLLRYMVKKYGRSLPIALFERSLQALALVLSNGAENADLLLSTVQLLSELARQYKEEDRGSCLSFYRDLIFPSLCTFVITKSSTVANATMRTLGDILQYVDASLAVVPDISKCASSIYFQGSQHCTEFSIHLAMQIIEKQQQLEAINFIEREALLRWIFSFLSAKSAAGSNLNANLAAKFILNLIYTGGYISLDVQSKEDKSERELLLDRFQFLANPLGSLQKRNSSESVNLTTDITEHVDTHLMDVLVSLVQSTFDALNQSENDVKEESTSESSPKRVEDIFYYCSVIQCLLCNHKAEDQLKVKLSNIYHNTFLLAVDKLKSISPQSQYWKKYLSFVNVIMEDLDAALFTSNKFDSARKCLQFLLIDLIKSSFEIDMNSSQISTTSDDEPVDYIMSDDIPLTSKSVVIKTGSSKNQSQIVAAALETLSIIGSRIPGSAQQIFKQIEEKLLDAPVSVMLTYDILLACAKMNNLELCMKILPATPTAVMDSRSFAQLLRIVGFVGRCFVVHKSQPEELCARMKKILTSVNTLYHRNELSEEGRSAFVECVEGCLGLEGFEDIAGYLLAFVNDNSYWLRLSVAKVIPAIGAYYNNSIALFSELWQDHLQSIIDASTNTLKTKTSLLLLANFALQNEQVEQDIVFKLVNFYSVQEEYVKELLNFISSGLQYACLLDMLEDHILNLLFCWLGNKRLEDFPFSLYGQSSLTAFIQQYGSSLIPFVVEKQDKTELALLAKSFTSLEVALKSHFSSLFAYYYLYSFRDRENNTIASFLTGTLGSQVSNLQKIEIDNILVDMFALSSADENCSLPFFSQTILRTAIQQLLTDFNIRLKVEDFLVEKKGRVHLILYNIHESIMSTHRVNTRLNHFSALISFIDLLGERSVSITSTLRYILHIVLEACKLQGLQDRACDLLLRLIRTADQNQIRDAIEEFGVNLPRIVSRMLDLIMKQVVVKPFTSRSSNSQGKTISDSQHSETQELLRSKPCLVLVDLMERISSFRPFLSTLDPFPAFHPIMIHFQKLYEKSRSSMNMFDEIRLFVQRKDAQGVSQLLKVLHHNKAQIIHAMDSKDQAITHLVSKLVANLLSICRGHFSTTDKLKAGECLGILGLSVPLVADNIDSEMYKEFEFDLISVTKWKTNEIMMDFKKKVLQALNQYLIDSEVHVVRIASETLRKVLNTKSGFDAYRLLDTNTQLYLQPFTAQLDSSPRRYTAAFYRFKSRDKYQEKYPEYSEQLFKTEGRSHREWVINVTYSLIESGVSDEVIRLCGDMCLCKPEFAELLFPLAIYDLVHICENQRVYTSMLSPLFNNQILGNKNCSHRTVRLLLTTLHILYQSNLEIIKTESVASMKQKYKYTLQLPYLKVAEAALHAEAVTTAMLYVEMNSEENYVLHPLLPKSFCYDEDAPLQQDLLLRAYRKTNEPDAIYGIAINYGINSFLFRAEHEADWQNALSSYDISISNPSSSIDAGKSISGILSSLRGLGYNNTAQSVITGLPKATVRNSSDVQEQIFESAWRTGIWDLVQSASSSQVGFNQSLFKCLKSLVEGNSSQFWKLHEASKLDVIRNIMKGTDIFANLAKLQMTSEVVDVWKLRWGNTSPDDSTLFKMPNTPSIDIIEKLVGGKGTKLEEHSFHYIEPLLALRSVLLKIVGRNDLIPRHMCSIASMARKEKQYSLATNIIHGLSFASNRSETASLWMPEEAKLLWARGERDSAVNTAMFLLDLLKQKNSSLQNELLGRTSCLLGSWLSHTQTESASKTEQYLTEARSKLKGNPPLAYKALYALAKHYDTLYTNLIRKMESQEYMLAQQTYKRNRATYELVAAQMQNKHAPNYNDLRQYGSTLAKTIKQDNEQQAAILKAKELYLHKTIETYVSAATCGSKHDLVIIFRICGLWFENSNSAELNKLFAAIIERKAISTHKFLPLVYQIASRIGDQTPFQVNVSRLLASMASDHPHHTLFQIFALNNGNVLAPDEKNKSSHKFDASKIKVANSILEEYRRTKDATLIAQMVKLIDAYIQLGFHNIDKETARQSGPVQMLKTFKIRHISHLTHTPISTIDIPCQPNAIYTPKANSDISLVNGDYPYIAGFEESFSLAGGVNLPKIVKCIGSDQKRYRQLVKGKDDLRQDAVMQQIFELVNNLLIADKETRKRNLKVRTYKVIPLGPTSGLLGWVEDTVPLAQYLVGTTKNPKIGAHYRYRPQDLGYMESRKLIAEAQSRDDAQKLVAFKDVCKRFQPVFHNFFTENFSNPADWFSRRLTYTRSVAANSMVGYIIGLGDRHSHNILMDLKSAECVHIDLGVAFDQGLLLPLPERIPFRLTRDIIDGFGVTGVEGTFTTCSEHVLSVLRHNSELISLVVEVFIHDPLYKWSLSPIQMYNLQTDKKSRMTVDPIVIDDTKDSQQTSTDARRALIRLKEKLQGYEGDEQLNVEGQVNKLIRAAQNQEYLSKMFYGWGAHI